MRDQTGKDNRQTAAFRCHDLTPNNEMAFSSKTNLQFYRFQLLKNVSFPISAYESAKNRHERYFTEKRV